MDRGEFLAILRESLEGYIPKDEVEQNLTFYREYFNNSSKSEKELLEELGDPRLIARTIIDAYKASKGPMADYYMEQARSEYSKEHSSAYSENTRENLNDAKAQLGRMIKWFSLIFGIIIVFIVVLAVAGAIIAYIFPVFLIIVLVLLLLDLFKKGS